MSDVFAVDLTLDLAPSVPGAVLDDLRWHLGVTDGPNSTDGAGGSDDLEGLDSSDGEMPDMVPLLCARGPTARIGGVLTGELIHTAAGHWSLTTRQQIHAELLPDLDSLVE